MRGFDPTHQWHTGWTEADVARERALLRAEETQLHSRGMSGPPEGPLLDADTGGLTREHCAPLTELGKYFLAVTVIAQGNKPPPRDIEVSCEPYGDAWWTFFTIHIDGSVTIEPPRRQSERIERN